MTRLTSGNMTNRSPNSEKAARQVVGRVGKKDTNDELAHFVAEEIKVESWY